MLNKSLTLPSNKITKETNSLKLSTRIKILSGLLFIVFLTAGWFLGLSPLIKNLKTIFQSGSTVKNIASGIPKVSVPSDYISEDQFDIDITHYNIKLDLHPEDRKLFGDVTLTGVSKNKDLTEIDLNFYDNFKIEKLLLNGKETDYRNEDTRLTINGNINKSDTFNIEIKYEGTPERGGLGSFTFGKKYGRPVVYNLSEPNYASTWFPCNDLPSDKAYLDIYLTNDSSFTSASNGILVDKKTTGTRSTYHWKTLYPISTYLICLYSSVYDEFNEQYVSQDKKDTMPIDYYAFPEDLENAKADFTGHSKMIDFFSKTFGEYPFINEKYGVAEFLWQLGAMEHQTLTGVGSNFVSGRRFFTDVYVHELAHQWFGDAVGPATWKDIWLNEGFATYCEALYDEHLAGAKALRSTMMSKFNDSFSGTVYNPGEDLFSSLVYDKGAWVLHMLRWQIGDDAFFNCLRNYFEKYKYSNASTEDFIKVCEESSGKNLNQFFSQWIFNGDNVPKINYKWNSEAVDDSFNVELNLTQYQDGYSDYSFPIQFSFKSESGKSETKVIEFNSSESDYHFKLDFAPVEAIPDPDNWLLVYFKLKGSD